MPGESYLDLLDGLYDTPIDTLVARHEGGAAMMAEAEGKMTGRPGVVLVTRGPGACNAAAGIHVAQQDSTPLVLIVGLIARAHQGREAFQEINLQAVFGSMAKSVEIMTASDRVPEILNRAFATAMAGRPGPAVIGLPEDVLRQTTSQSPGPRVEASAPSPSADACARAVKMLAQAQSPILIAGGSRWTPRARNLLRQFSQAWALPIAVSFRRQSLFDARHPNYAGDVGLGVNPKLAQRIQNADLVLLLGGRFSENPSQGFTLISIPGPQMPLIHVHPGAEELGRIYTPSLALHAAPEQFLEAILEHKPSQGWPQHSQAAHQDYLQWSQKPPPGVGALTMSHVVSVLRETLTEDTIITNGAGNYAAWLHRFIKVRPDGHLGPTSGTMGYGLPAAIAAQLRYPQRQILCLAGDGCFQMTASEFGLAAARALPLKILLCDNGMHGTIRMHQERSYPERICATTLHNPDFAAWAQSYGALGITVKKNQDFAAAWESARDYTQGPALLHLCLDPRDLAPGVSLG